jgi:hypothetical protein
MYPAISLGATTRDTAIAHKFLAKVEPDEGVGR